MEHQHQSSAVPATSSSNLPESITPEININSEDSSVPLGNNEKNSIIEQDDEDEPSMLDSLTSEQLARRPSFKKILEDLSAADPTLQKTVNPELMTSAAALQAQQLQAALQQVASSGAIAGTSLLPGLLQGGVSASSNGDLLSSQLSVMLPAQQQIQLQSALLQSMNAHSSGVVQSLASQNNIPASLISSALINANVAASISASTSQAGGMKVSQVGQPAIVEDSSRKREVRLMKNREAARECRRKKKEYVRCLESRVAVLESQNQALIGELRALKELYLPKSQDNN